MKPMIVVMPAGHTNPPPPAAGAAPANATDEFVSDFLTDVMPYVEKNYRTINDRNNRAIAGLSMGGSQTLYAAIPNLDKFAYIGVFSSGLLGGGGGRGAAPAAPAAAPAAPAPPFGQSFEERYKAQLDNAAAKKGVKVFWFATGKDDGLITTTRSTVDFFKKHGFAPTMKESEGGHTWLNWRDYLVEFTPLLFQ
jgi:enterochelin esterase family protein